MLILHGVTYMHPNRDLLFKDLNLTINQKSKTALIGNNGSGKSTLLKILSEQLKPSSGLAEIEVKPYYVPQHFGQYDDQSIAEVLGLHDKLTALHEILSGNGTEQDLVNLDDDWLIEERCAAALAHWKLNFISLTASIGSLSGGQKTKVFLAGIFIHQPKLILLDEPSNHLDLDGRNLLYDYIESTSSTLLVVSHDRKLLNLLDHICELSKDGITTFGGNYDFYLQQKQIDSEALHQDLKSKEKALRKAKEIEKASLERQQKLDARGKKKQEKAGLSRISMNTLKNNAEKSTSKVKDVHAEKVNEIAQGLRQLRSELPATDKMKIDFHNSRFRQGKKLIIAEGVNFRYHHQALWPNDLDFEILVGERIALKGSNGSGKTTLIKLILGQSLPQTGLLKTAATNPIYVDQDYSFIKNKLTVYEQAQFVNSGALQEHDIKIRLNRFLFTPQFWDKSCLTLSGGEKMRLTLCCLTILNQAPDLIVLDEPTNNLDVQNVEMLTAAVNDYQGTLLVVSHDEYFLKQIGIEREILL